MLSSWIPYACRKYINPPTTLNYYDNEPEDDSCSSFKFVHYDGINTIEIYLQYIESAYGNKIVREEVPVCE